MTAAVAVFNLANVTLDYFFAVLCIGRSKGIDVQMIVNIPTCSELLNQFTFPFSASPELTPDWLSKAANSFITARVSFRFSLITSEPSHASNWRPLYYPFDHLISLHLSLSLFPILCLSLISSDCLLLTAHVELPRSECEQEPRSIVFLISSQYLVDCEKRRGGNSIAD